jgi:ABC-type dipeptide/oligopeptide/nickel transport system permease component
MVRFVIIRILQTIIALIGISILIFVLVRASGDAVDLFRTPSSTEEELANIRLQLGLDKSQPEQYYIFVKDLVQGDLGYSYIKKRPVTTMIGEALPNSLRLGGSAFVIGMAAALALGVLAATRRDSWLDNGVKFLAVLGQAVPGFWLAIMSIFIFSVYLNILPAMGTKNIANYVLPVGTLAFFLLPGMMRLVRSSMLDVLDSEYVKLARIKGLPERIVIWKHALRNALIAPLTTAGLIFANIITGAVIIETVFAWPGVGRLSVSAMVARDFPVVQGVTLLVGALVLIVNLLVDITYAYIDPQIRYQKT